MSSSTLVTVTLVMEERPGYQFPVHFFVVFVVEALSAGRREMRVRVKQRDETWTQGDPTKQEETFPHKLDLRDNIVSQAASHRYWGVIPMDLPRYMYSLGGMMAERQGLCCQSAMERFCGYRHWPLMCTLLQRSYHLDIVGIVTAVSPHLKPRRVTAAVVWFCISERFRSRYVSHLHVCIP